MSQIEWLTEISTKLETATRNMQMTNKVESGLGLIREVISEIDSERETLMRMNEELSDDEICINCEGELVNGQCPECNFAFKVDTFYPNNRTSDEVNVFLNIVSPTSIKLWQNYDDGWSETTFENNGEINVVDSETMSLEQALERYTMFGEDDFPNSGHFSEVLRGFISKSDKGDELIWVVDEMSMQMARITRVN